VRVCCAFVLVFTALGLECMGVSCSANSSLPPVTGGLDGESGDTAEPEAEANVPPKTCSDYGGECMSGGACPVQVTGIALCGGDQICCAGYGNDP
jgi:hypothetical protein